MILVMAALCCLLQAVAFLQCALTCCTCYEWGSRRESSTSTVGVIAALSLSGTALLRSASAIPRQAFLRLDQMGRPMLAMMQFVAAALLLALPMCAAGNAVSSVSETTAVLRVPRSITFAGSGVAAGDRVFWMNDRPDCDVVPINDGGVLRLDQSLSVDATFSTVSPEGVPFKLCYGFGTAPFQMVSNMTVEVMVSSLACLVSAFSDFVRCMVLCLLHSGRHVAQHHIVCGGPRRFGSVHRHGRLQWRHCQVCGEGKLGL